MGFVRSRCRHRKHLFQLILWCGPRSCSAVYIRFIRVLISTFDIVVKKRFYIDTVPSIGQFAIVQFILSSRPSGYRSQNKKVPESRQTSPVRLTSAAGAVVQQFSPTRAMSAREALFIDSLVRGSVEFSVCRRDCFSSLTDCIDADCSDQTGSFLYTT